MKNVIFVFIFSFLIGSGQVCAQSKLETLVGEGIELFDKGEYDKAIEKYKKALAIDSKSDLVNYEIALTYLQKKDYKKVIEHTDVVLKQKDSKHLLAAYLAKGSAVDLMGETEKSIKIFEEAIQKVGKDYLLYYNLAFNHFKLKHYKETAEYADKAIQENPNHASSHLLLALSNDALHNRTQTVLAASFFLLLEPNSKRAVDVFSLLKESLSGDVDKKDANTTNITISSTNTEFSSLDLMIAMLEASKSLEENKNKSEDEMFVKNMTSIFKSFGEIKENTKNKGNIYWDFYIPFFVKIANSEHIETYCNYISQSSNENAKKWLKQNSSKLESFAKWMESN
jgi:tetratricopeptide (TPR) repeat protein